MLCFPLASGVPSRRLFPSSLVPRSSVQSAPRLSSSLIRAPYGLGHLVLLCCGGSPYRGANRGHKVPYNSRTRGGQHVWANCVASCTICNHRKADRLLEELGWTLAVPPAVPRGAHWRLVGAQHDGDPQWAAYLREPSAALEPSAA